MALLKRAATLTWAQAGQALGHYAGASAQELSVADVHVQGLEQEFAVVIEQFATRLDTSTGSNFGARRRAFANLTTVPAETWARICARAGVRVAPTRRRRWAATWLWTLLTCGDYRAAPAYRSAPSSVQPYGAYGSFVRDDLPELRPELEAVAHTVLDDRLEGGGAVAGSFLGLRDSVPYSPFDIWTLGTRNRRRLN